jgi:hypothetical protein
MRLAAAALAMLAFAGSASATGPDIPSAIRDALAWLAQNSPYPAVSPPRSYAVLDAEQMRTSAVNLGGAENAGAIYHCSSQSVLLRDTFDPRRVWDMAVLVHEMTHHLQCVTRGMGLACEREREAYDMQLRFLEQMATDGRDRLPALRKRYDEVVARHCQS